MATGRKKWIWIIAGIFLLMTALVLYKTKTRKKGVEVQTEEVKERTITELVTASGKIYPETEIKISSDVSGEIVELFVKEGDSVRFGQVLARINPDVYQSAVERTTAGVNVARSQAKATQVGIQAARSQRDQIAVQLRNAEKILERNRQLYKEGVIALAELENTETTVDNLRANLRSAEANIESVSRQSEGSGFGVKDAEAMLKEQRTNLGRTIIRAPVSGIISRLNVEKGERVVGTVQMSGTELMRIADLSVMEVQVEVSENDIIRIALGNESDVEVDAWRNKFFKGTVTEISNSASNIGITQLSSDQVTKFIVKVRIDSASYAELVNEKRQSPFKPGMSATVEIKTKKVERAISIPIQSVLAYNPEEEKNNKNKSKAEEDKKTGDEEEKEEPDYSKFIEAVYVRSGDTVIRKDVTTGIQDQDYIEIIRGLELKEEVITGPYSAISRLLKPGSRIHVNNSEK